MTGTDSGTSTVEIVQTVAQKRWTASQKLRMIEESMHLTIQYPEWLVKKRYLN